MQKRKILVLEPFSKKHLDLMSEAAGNSFILEQILPPFDELQKKMAVKQAEIIIGEPEIELLEEPEKNCPELKFIQMTWAGTDIYTRNAELFPKDKILAANASGAYGYTMSQFVIAQILSLMLNLKAYGIQQEQKKWMRLGEIQSLENAEVLIYGAGNIGSMTAKRLTGFDAHVTGVCRNVEKPRKYFDELCTLEDAEKYLGRADAVVCCMPDSKETAGYFNAERLKLMKQNAVIVNVGRGNFIDCMALDEELRNGHLWGAALDVTNPEPLPVNHPLWENSKCIITPHTSGVGFGHLEKTVDLICGIACENIRRYCKNEKILNSVF